MVSFVNSLAERPDPAGVAELLDRSGRGRADFSLDDCAGGGNNRVFVVRAGAERFVVKWYFTHPSDTRDRLRAEFAFLQYATAIGREDVPRPIAALPDRSLALYEHVEGTKLGAAELRPHHVGLAAEFLLALNGADRHRLGAALPEASEARFSIATHFGAVRDRVARLASISGDSPEDDEARELAKEIAALERKITAGIAARASELGLGAEVVLAPSARFVSPSDFGFHNALQRPDGTLCFLDFEYAGWDDPAKMVCDFFWQPAVPVPREHFESFLAQCLRHADAPGSLADRARMLFPLFGLKWCCIVLNEFLPATARRRQFADAAAGSVQRKRAQLDKARRLIAFLEH